MTAASTQPSMIENVRCEVATCDLTYAEKKLIAKGMLAPVLKRLQSTASHSAGCFAIWSGITAVIGLGLLFGGASRMHVWIWAVSSWGHLALAAILGFISTRQRREADHFAHLLKTLRETKCGHH